MKNKRQILKDFIRAILLNLQELTETKSVPNDFCLGQIYAFVECLEILQLCPSFRNLGLDYDIKKSFPLYFR